MPGALKLKVACDPFESVRALMERRIQPEGVELEFAPEMSNPVRHRGMVRDLAFDLCELNISTYLIARDQGVPITALPLFLYRKFRHGSIFVNPASGVRSAKDLEGAVLGCPTVQAASNVWIHGVLSDAGELDHRKITWLAERDEDIAFQPRGALRIERTAPKQSVVDLLLAGEIAAVTTPQTPAAYLAGDPRIVRLFPDYVERERAYYTRTGLFPIMHVTAAPTALLEREPWIVEPIMRAFEASKAEAYAHAANVRVANLAWFGALWEEERALLGDDPWLYGLGENNIRNVMTAVRYTHEQGMTSRMMSLGELFHGA
jgi:4,5-dihydroxyphthalate decarboxylase